MLIWTSRNIPNVGLFSAYAEVFLDSVVVFFHSETFLCLRRGVSFTPSVVFLNPLFSLPTQRCFQPQPSLTISNVLFSAYAEVFSRTGAFHRR